MNLPQNISKKCSHFPGSYEGAARVATQQGDISHKHGVQASVRVAEEAAGPADERRGQRRRRAQEVRQHGSPEAGLDRVLGTGARAQETTVDPGRSQTHWVSSYFTFD